MHCVDCMPSANSETKIVLKAGSSEELMSLNEKAKSLNLPTFTVHDAGKTQVHGKTKFADGKLGNCCCRFLQVH